MGLSDTLNEESVKLYCAKCSNVYNSRLNRHEHVDGAYFGTTFPNLFFLTFPELKPTEKVEKYTPKVFGYNVHKQAYKRSLDAKRQAVSGDRKIRS